jgi:hypothetical protein
MCRQEGADGPEIEIKLPAPQLAFVQDFLVKRVQYTQDGKQHQKSVILLCLLIDGGENSVIQLMHLNLKMFHLPLQTSSHASIQLPKAII